MSKMTPDTQAIVDQHLEALMLDLKRIGFPASGAVVGILHGDETSVSWCVEDDVKSEDGETVPVEVIVREIAVGIDLATAE